MRKIPFNVSARTARLIGRENVSSAEGALIELVKNSYDADADFCIVYFEDCFSELPRIANKETIRAFATLLNDDDILSCYEPQLFEEEWKFSEQKFEKTYSKEQRSAIDNLLGSTVKIHVLDNGDGMVESTIENSWMTIGTANKNENFISDKSGRVKSGAKGIGRFALDRLGEKCRLTTKTKESNTTLLWKVNWSDFDAHGLTIDRVNAELGDSKISLDEDLKELLGESLSKELLSPELNALKGTHISISNLRDSWKYVNIEKIYKELESLAPPSEAGKFSVYVLSKKHVGEFGKVESNQCEDFDYKLTAQMDDSGTISIEIFRREIDKNKISQKLLAREIFKEPRYLEEKLTSNSFTYKKKLGELLPGLTDHNEDIHKSIGSFDFALYFMKRSSDGQDAETYLHRKFDSEARKKWLNNNSGIRVFRDNFRVRPYGEIGKSSWDWLGLGRRQAEDPSAVRTGRWKVAPHNISGAVQISRINNLGLEDKSSREGIQENESFELFKNIIEALIKEFEADRSRLYSELYKFSLEQKNTPTEDEINPAQEKDAEEIAQQIFDNIKKEKTELKDNSSKLALALLKEKARSREIDDRLEEMKKENSLLRVFASSGITIASFTHELDSLNSKLGGRFDQLVILLNNYIELSPQHRQELPTHRNPFKRIDMLQKDDERVKNWIKYSLRTIRKDKRKRTKINIKTYLENLRDEWNSTLIERQIVLDVFSNPGVSLRAYEIDLDCIFNNLIINSADAFKRSGFDGERKIHIYAEESETAVAIRYKDTGPGLSASIQVPTDIFKPTYTTKVNNIGEDVGTGLGMWLVQKTLDEYRGTAKLEAGTGFGLNMELLK